MEDTDLKKQKFRLSILWKNIIYAFSIYWKERKIFIFIYVLSAVLRVALPYAGILLPKIVIDQIEQQSDAGQFLMTVGGMALLLVVLNYIKSFSDNITDNLTGTVGILSMIICQADKEMTMDYELMENPEFKKIKDKAGKAIQSNHSIAMNYPRTIVQFLSNIGGFLLYSIVIISINPLILPLLFVSAAVNWLMLTRARKYDAKTREERGKLGNKMFAVVNVMREPESAKDIRLYSAFGWLQGLLNNITSEYKSAELRMISKNFQTQITEAILILLRDSAAYAYLIYLLLDNRLSLGDFVFVFAAVGAMAGWISGILTSATDLAKSNTEMSDVSAFLNYPNNMNTGEGIPLPAKNELPPSIELKDLEYTYPNADKPTLKDINLTIKQGERIAIVGANGAGKTTLVKLISGLYMPTKGGVYLNNHSFTEYNRDEYYSLFSTVFQDIHLLTTDISGNISQQPPEATDMEKVNYSLRMSGLDSKINSLPDKEKSLLVRSVNENAVELSGGEKQKLAMARALYKDAPIIILDEPTAALDPIAENEVYQKYAQLTAGKTSVYISHRLASTRFCDRILLIDENTIAEQGSHEELMARKGVYAHMFEVQASYYQKSAQPISWEEEALNGIE